MVSGRVVLLVVLLVVFLMLMPVALVAVLLTSGLTSSVAEGAGALTTKKESFDVLFAAGNVKFNGR